MQPNNDRRQIKVDFTVKWIDKSLYDKLLGRRYKVDNGKPWLLRKGRNWIAYHWGDSKRNGWWMFGYRMWSPHLYLMPVALWYYRRTGENNFFYMPERRKRIGLKW